MNFRRILLLLTLLVGALPAVHAEDIDLFTGASNATIAASNLLIVIDNAAAFDAKSSSPDSTCTIGGVTNSMAGKVGGVEQCVLYSVVSSLSVTSTATLNLGIMVYSGNNAVKSDGTQCGGNVGGCLVYPLTGLTTSTKPAFLNFIKSWSIKANSEATGATMQESWAYYAAKMGLSGTDYSNTGLQTNCKNFLLFLADATSTSATPGDATGNQGPAGALARTNSTGAMNVPAPTPRQDLITTTAVDQVTACGTLTSTPSPHENKGFYADEWARYMRSTSSPKITSYSIALVDAAGKCDPQMPWLMASIASWGGANTLQPPMPIL